MPPPEEGLTGALVGSGPAPFHGRILAAMARAPLVLVTGFGPFPGVEHNPSGELALALAADPPPGAAVRADVLPVTFDGVGAAYDELLAGSAPDVLLSLGVHRGPEFRLERRARGRLETSRPDAAGRVGGVLELSDEPELACGYDLEELARVLIAAGAASVRLSSDAGQYVCERTYHHVLTRARERGLPALFLHVPPLEFASVEEQLAVVRPLVAHLPVATWVAARERRLATGG